MGLLPPILRFLNIAGTREALRLEPQAACNIGSPTCPSLVSASAGRTNTPIALCQLACTWILLHTGSKAATLVGDATISRFSASIKHLILMSIPHLHQAVEFQCCG